MSGNQSLGFVDGYFRKIIQINGDEICFEGIKKNEFRMNYKQEFILKLNIRDGTVTTLSHI